jgi:hypothetical protein
MTITYQHDSRRYRVDDSGTVYLYRTASRDWLAINEHKTVAAMTAVGIGQRKLNLAKLSELQGNRR